MIKTFIILITFGGNWSDSPVAMHSVEIQATYERCNAVKDNIVKKFGEVRKTVAICVEKD